VKQQVKVFGKEIKPFNLNY